MSDHQLKLKLNETFRRIRDLTKKVGKLEHQLSKFDALEKLAEHYGETDAYQRDPAACFDRMLRGLISQIEDLEDTQERDRARLLHLELVSERFRAISMDLTQTVQAQRNTPTYRDQDGHELRLLAVGQIYANGEPMVAYTDLHDGAVYMRPEERWRASLSKE